MLLVQLGDLHVRFHFGVESNTVSVTSCSLVIHRFIMETFLMEGHIVPIQSRPVEIISEYSTTSDSLAVVQTYLDA